MGHAIIASLAAGDGWESREVVLCCACERSSRRPEQSGKGGIACLRGNAQWSHLSPTGPSLPNRRSASDARLHHDPRRHLQQSGTGPLPHSETRRPASPALDQVVVGNTRRQETRPRRNHTFRPSPSDSDRMKPTEAQQGRKMQRWLPMAAFLLVATNNAVSQLLHPIRQELSEFHLRNYGRWAQLKSKRYPVTGSMLVTARKQGLLCPGLMT